MRYTLLVIVLILSSCSSRPPVASGTVARKESVIYVGMGFDQADARLKQYGAASTMYQMELTPKAYKAGKELHYYQLRSGAVVDIISQPGKTGRVVGSLSVSTYEPKSWDSKLDPERDKFFESFENRDEYDLAGEASSPAGPILQGGITGQRN